MGNCCWTQCFGLLRKEAGRLQRVGGGGGPLTEEEIVDLRERHYDSIAEKQKDLDKKIQKELALQEEKLRLEEEALYAAQREAARAAKQRKLLEVRGKDPSEY
ncbi:AP-1 complex-associated regulatory protein [Sciurus carolinensis]|uniref:AP-1 complex-associated regulatory protein n=1 Tax=Sciurus carolinensis TaxID=30640 RepID=A0AA41SU54_SCICA|nr:AP-1 complex-associated regulatory protein [Sciurus carolinensis]